MNETSEKTCEKPDSVVMKETLSRLVDGIVLTSDCDRVETLIDHFISVRMHELEMTQESGVADEYSADDPEAFNADIASATAALRNQLGDDVTQRVIRSTCLNCGAGVAVRSGVSA